MADFTRPAQGFDFTFGGVNLRSPADGLKENEYACAMNIRAISEKTIQTRPGYVSVFGSSAGQPITDVKAYSTLGTDNLPRFLCRDSQNHIIIDSGPTIATLSGSVGSGACMLPFRPNNSAQSWMYVCGLGEYRKFSAPNSSGGIYNQKVGIAEPQTALDAATNAPVFTSFLGTASTWTNSGTAGSLSDLSLSTDTAGAVIADPALSSRISVGVTNPIYIVGMLATFAATNTYPVEEFWPACATCTISAIRYDSGTSGLCSIVTSVDLSSSIGRGSLVTLTAETVLVLSVASGANGTCVFRCSTSGTHSSGETVTGVCAIVVHGTVTTGQAITVPVVSSTLDPGIGILSHTIASGVFSKYSPNDYIHVTLLTNNIALTDSITFVFDVSGVSPTYTNNVLTYTVRGDALSPQLVAGQMIEIHFPISSLSATPGALNSCLGIQIQLTVTGITLIDMGGLWVGGAGEPDTGDQGAPYEYRAVPRSAITGAIGNPSPTMRYGVTPFRQSITVKLISAAYDSQIDIWDIYRYGGTVLSWRYIGSASSSASTFTDNVYDDAAGAGAEMQTDNFEPWPSIDVPFTVSAGSGNTITLTGTSLVVNGPSTWPTLITQWMPGTLVTIAGLGTYTLRSRPVALSGTSYLFELEECAGYYLPGSISITEPIVARASVPYMWGPNEQGNMFAVGDALRPGNVYYCKSNNPDSAPDKNNIELSPPSEPLIGGALLGGISMVASTDRWWALYPSFSYTAQLSGSAQGQQYTKIEQAVGRGLVAPYGHCSDGQAIFFFAKDCIATTPGGGFKSLTDAQLYPLFPHEGVAGQNITRNGVTFYAPDYSRAATFRLARASNYLYADYEDSTGTHRTLVCDLRTGAWSTDVYHDSITIHYSLEQQEGTLGTGTPALYPMVVMGDTAGNLWKQQDLNNDNASAIACVLATFEWDGGDKRAQGRWGDLYLDSIPAAAITATPMSLGSALAAATSILAASSRKFTPISLAGGVDAKYVGLQLSWTDNYLTQSIATLLRVWQPSIAAKPETVTDRYGDWDDAGSPWPKYFTGIQLGADTFNLPKSLGIRVKDDSSLRTISVLHNGELTKAYAFSTPFVGHLVRDESQDAVPWRKFGIKWLCEPWPELLTDVSQWFNMGTSGTKYLRGCVIPIECGGLSSTIRIVSSDSTVTTITATGTAPLVKTPYAFSFTVPLIGHEFQIQPQTPTRIWEKEIKWDFEPWPELTAQASPWINPNQTSGAKYLRGLIIPMDTDGQAVVLRVYSPDGSYVELTSTTTTAQTKTPVAFATVVPLIGKEFQIIPQSPCRIWYEEIRWDFDPYPELITEASPWMNLGAPGAKYLRGLVLPMDTGGLPIVNRIISSDSNVTNLPSTVTAPSVKTPVPFVFTTPLIGHEFQIQPQSPCRIWLDEARWDFEPWPELTAEASPWMNLGAPGAKYLRGLVLPMDTGGLPIVNRIISSDSNVTNLPSTITAPSVKTPVAFAFTVPLIGHEFQILPQSPCRIWLDEAQWIYDKWPELTAEASAWINPNGSPGAKYLRGLIIPMDTDGSPVVLRVYSPDGSYVTLTSTTTTAQTKTPVAFATVVPLIGKEFQIIPQSPCRIWYEEIRWDFDPYPELITEASPWMNLGAPGAKYLRGLVLPMDTGGLPVVNRIISSDSNVTNLPSTITSPAVKTPVPFAFTIPLIGHEFQIQPQSPCRIWLDEARWDFDPWPELISEATGWLQIMADGGSAFLQGFVAPVEAGGAMPALTLITDRGDSVALTSILTPAANVKTSVPYSLATPVVAHQVQLVPSAACRIWLQEIKWIAQSTPEQASTWKTPFTGHGLKGYQYIPWIDAAYSSTAAVTLTITSFDGTSPAVITLPSTGGVYKKVRFVLTPNKGMLFKYEAVSSDVFQLFLNDWTIWIGAWGRKSGLIPYRNLGGEFGDKAPI